MARPAEEQTADHLFKAGETWLELSLAEGRSVFSNQIIWTPDNIQALDTWFSNNLDAGEGDFFEKLEVQLSECDAEVKKLAAEILWLMLLCPRNISAGKKRESILRIWAWSGDELPSDHALLSDETLAGVGNAGTSFNTNRWRELAYCVELFKRTFQLSATERLQLFGDYNQLAAWLGEIPESERRQFRHMLLYLLHPDQIERIFSSGERKTIVSKFTGKPLRVVNKLTAAEVDAQIREIRQAKEAEFGTKKLDFYQPPLKELWKDQTTKSWLFAWNPKIGTGKRCPKISLKLEKVSRL